MNFSRTFLLQIHLFPAGSIVAPFASFDALRRPWVRDTEYFRLFVASFLLPLVSSVFWWMQTASAMHLRGWVNAEYVILLCVTLLYPSWWMIALLTTELAASVIEPIAHLYYFSPLDAVYSLRYLAFLPGARLAGYGAMLTVYLAGSAILLRTLLGRRRSPRARQMIYSLLLCLGVMLALEVGRGRRVSISQTRMYLGDGDLTHHHAIQTPVLSLVRGMSFAFWSIRPKPFRALPSAMNRAVGDSSATTTRPNLVLVLTESWGLANDDRLNQLYLQPYRSNAVEAQYRVETGTVPFLGSTTSGETRELCGDSHGRSEADLPEGYFKGCWPARLAGKGYRTLAVHGFTPGMFQRKEWYDQMGFAESDFLPELERDGADLCNGAFPGACDADVAHWIGRRLLAADDRPMFVHWVTLNSHLPLPYGDKAPSAECVALGIAEHQSLCTWSDRILTVQRSVADMATTAGLAPTIFVIVGDHAPPFMRAGLRGRFSQTVVPYVILMPKATDRERRSVAGLPSSGGSAN